MTAINIEEKRNTHPCEHNRTSDQYQKNLNKNLAFSDTTFGTINQFKFG